MLEFYSYATMVAAIPHVSPVHVIEAGDFRLMFPSKEEADAFLAMDLEARASYVEEILRKQPEEAANAKVLPK